MNRTDILKKCVDRGVAGETEVGAVSHLFYVYLLSALQRGQRVEIPKFGTFGTRVAGVKKVRKIPYFEPEQELARKVNERFENLKYLVTGRYEPLPVPGDSEYRGREVPFDPLAEQGKETVIDTTHEVSLDEFQASSAGGRYQQQEENIMPRLNLKDEGGMDMEQPPLEPEQPSTPPPPTLREVDAGGRVSPLVLALIGVFVLAIGVFALNYFNVVHLWGKKAPRVTVADSFPEPAPMDSAGRTGEAVGQPPAATEQPPAETTPLPTAPKGSIKREAPERPAVAASTPTTGTGNFTIQVSSWFSRSKANKESAKLTGAGFDAYVVDVDLSGETWHRVRVGRFGSQAQAKVTLSRLAEIAESQPFIARVGN